MTATKNNPILCPTCGAPMNHHADKLIELRDGKLQEEVEEFHRCPDCGTGVSRRGSLISD